MPEIDDISSLELQLEEDLISGDFCGNCGHLINEEHYIGSVTGLTKCFALTFNGTVWESCRCTNVLHKQYEIKVMVPNNAYNPQSTTNSSSNENNILPNVSAESSV